MFRVAPLAVVASLCLPLPAFAEDAPGTAGGRFVLEKAGDGFIRLDRQTGAVSRCLEKRATGLADRLPTTAPLRAQCQFGRPRRPQGRDQRLERQNEELKRRIAVLEKHPGNSSSGTTQLPSQQAWTASWPDRELDAPFVDFARSLGHDSRERQDI
jgi:hypothetical protein